MNGMQGIGGLAEDYEILEELGRGGSSIVYRGRERELHRDVAIKVIRDDYLEDAEARARVDREAHTLAQLKHPNIVGILAARRLADGSLALVMPLSRGRTLRAELEEKGRFAFERTAWVLEEIGAALAYLHRQHIIHRDVKPENIFLEEDGRVLLSDLGIAKRRDGTVNVTLAGVVVGTPAYMSPEQIDGIPLDGRTDLYSLGLVGYELLTGKQPWEGENLFNVIFKQKTQPLPLLDEVRPGVPVPLRQAIERALCKDREQRWASAEEFVMQLGTTVPPVAAVSGLMTHLPLLTMPASNERETEPARERNHPSPDDLPLKTRPIHELPPAPTPTRVQVAPPATDAPVHADGETPWLYRPPNRPVEEPSPKTAPTPRQDRARMREPQPRRDDARGGYAGRAAPRERRTESPPLPPLPREPRLDPEPRTNGQGISIALRPAPPSRTGGGAAYGRRAALAAGAVLFLAAGALLGPRLTTAGGEEPAPLRFAGVPLEEAPAIEAAAAAPAEAEEATSGAADSRGNAARAASRPGPEQSAAASSRPREPEESERADDARAAAEAPAPELVRGSTGAPEAPHLAARALELFRNTFVTPPVAPPEATSTAEGAVDFVGPRIRNPSAVAERLRRAYPRELLQQGAGGTVVVDLELNPQGGVVHSVLARSSGISELDIAALRIARELRFVPARRDGLAVQSRVLLPLIFSPEERE